MPDAADLGIEHTEQLIEQGLQHGIFIRPEAGEHLRFHGLGHGDQLQRQLATFRGELVAGFVRNLLFALEQAAADQAIQRCLLYTSPSPRD